MEKERKKQAQERRNSLALLLFTILAALVAPVDSVMGMAGCLARPVGPLVGCEPPCYKAA